MVYENIATLLYAVTVFFALLTLVFTIKNREFERGEIENTVNALLFGFFISFEYGNSFNRKSQRMEA